jgi:hypothetical protein
LSNPAWSLLCDNLPSGSETYETYIVFSLFTDDTQLADFRENSSGEMNLMTQPGVKKGLKTRDDREGKKRS